MNAQLEFAPNDKLDDALLYGTTWTSVAHLCALTGLSRREIRELSHKRGYAFGNNGLALFDRISPEEQRQCRARAVSTLKSWVKRLQDIDQKINDTSTLPLRGILEQLSNELHKGEV